MDLHTIESVIRPADRDRLPAFRDGDAFLGGGTWLFSEPQLGLRRLIDLAALRWPALRIGPEGVRIAATCTLAELEAQSWPDTWRAAQLVAQCCRSLLGSFKIWNTATVGGNICLALPAAPMVSLATALEGVCIVLMPNGGERPVSVSDFVTGDNRNALAPGEILREVVLPARALCRRTAFRQISLTPLGRSAALLIGSHDAAGFDLTITASTPRPIRLHFADMPEHGTLAERIDAGVPAWHDDLHGAPDWRRHITHIAALEIRYELAVP